MVITEEYFKYVRKTYNKNYSVAMAACALIEEIIEFNDDPGIDEYGDVLYQFIVLCILTGVDIHEIKPQLNPLAEKSSKLTIRYIIRIAAQYKKYMTRLKPIDRGLIKTCLSHILYDILDASDTFNISNNEAMAYNVQKLERRYNNQ